MPDMNSISARDFARSHEMRDKEMMFLVGRIEELRSALQKIADESLPDTAYSWCPAKLAKCNEIARNALSPEQPDETA